ncbi:MAG: NAD(P)-binding domain-containing protein, partial [Actinomycetota bacterium]
MIKVGILGGSGFVGAELLRICASHTEFNVVYATGDSQAGSLASSLYPNLTGAYPNLIFDEYSLEATLKCDVVFLALPHEASLEIVPELLGKVRLVVDCSAAFRLKDASLYPQWYG